MAWGAISRIGVLAAAVLAVGCSGPNYDDQISALTSEIALLKQQVRELTLTTVDTTPATLAAPTTTVPATATTLDVNSAVLMGTYTWGEQSDAVRDLQVLIGASADGIYGPKTRAAHLVALVAAGLSVDHVPDQPVTTTPAVTTAPTDTAATTTTSTTTVMSSTTTLPTDVGDDDTSADSEADPADDPSDDVVPGDEP
ncbi:MAG: hypothetical protein O3A28_03070 [Actinomycetota bacterium]|nr:hypothetical protein [Actinomycetota bacterium]MDA3006608.1 hypothetical protein [Actinomycetota bacterium]MDA3033996.1 hypothetical protein [Actinomycetota bacterium]